MSATWVYDTVHHYGGYQHLVVELDHHGGHHQDVEQQLSVDQHGGLQPYTAVQHDGRQQHDGCQQRGAEQRDGAQHSDVAGRYRVQYCDELEHTVVCGQH